MANTPQNNRPKPYPKTISGLPGESTLSNEANLKVGYTAQDLLRSSYEMGETST